jgi:predicted nucleic acid-binding protein
VLRREKFRAFLTAEQADRYVEALARDATVVGDPAQRPAVSRDSGDDHLVALARVADAHVLVSGDSDLVDLELADLRIESPAAFLELLPD